MPQERVNPKDGWALFLFVGIAMLAAYWWFTPTASPPQSLIADEPAPPVQQVQYREPEVRVEKVYLPAPTQQAQQPPINISIIVDGEKIEGKATPVTVEQGETQQVVTTPKRRVKQTNPECDQHLREHEQRIAEWSKP